MCNDLSSRINTKANDNEVVHKTDNEDINGVKNFNSATYNTVLLNDSRTGAFIAKNMNYTLGNNPSSNIASQIQTKDSTDDWTSLYQYKYQTDGQVSISMQCRKQDKSTNGTLSVGYQPNGSFFSFVPACDASQSIVTTVNKSKAKNGYFQFGNGLIVNWGYFSSANNGAEFSFQKAFTNASTYGMTLCVDITSSATSGYYVWSYAHTASTFKIGASQTNNLYCWWIAIGY